MMLTMIRKMLRKKRDPKTSVALSLSVLGPNQFPATFESVVSSAGSRIRRWITHKSSAKRTEPAGLSPK